MDSTHRDYAIVIAVRDALAARVGSLEQFKAAIPQRLKDAVDYVIDPVRTARTSIAELDKVEKTFLGLKVEHVFRDLVDLPAGLRDLRVGDMDVDIKNSVTTAWMIPQETYSNVEPCILFGIADEEQTCSVGIMVARMEYLGSPNRDQKRGITAVGRANTLWLLKDEPFPASRWVSFDMARFRELRKVRGGTRRAVAFFTENLRRRVSRQMVLSLLFDQDDPMKRLRGNGGARDRLRPAKIALIPGSGPGSIDGGVALSELGLGALTADEWIAVRGDNASEETILRSHHLID